MIIPILLSVFAIASYGVRAEPSCPAVDGEDSVYFPHSDCTKFWQCSNGTPYLFDCPDQLHFNTDLNVCDWPQNAGCDGSGESSVSGENSGSSESGESSEESSESDSSSSESAEDSAEN